MLSCFCFQALQAFVQGDNSFTDVYKPYIQLLNSFPAWSIFATMPLSTTSTMPWGRQSSPAWVNPLSAETPLFSPVLPNSAEICCSPGNYLAKSQALLWLRDLDEKLDCHHPDLLRTGCPKRTCVTEECCPPESGSDF